jgi:hypothetical protein
MENATCNVSFVEYEGSIGVLTTPLNADASLHLQKQLHPWIFESMTVIATEIPVGRMHTTQLRHYYSDGKGRVWGDGSPEKYETLRDTFDIDRILDNLRSQYPKLHLSEPKPKGKAQDAPKKSRVAVRKKKSAEFLKDAIEIYALGGKVASYRKLAQLVGCSVSFITKYKSEIGIDKATK